MSILSIKEIEHNADFERLGSEWNGLLSQSESDTVFLTWEWLSTWWRIYGSGKKLRVITAVDENGDLVAIAPLYQRFRKACPGLTIREVRFLGTGEDVSPDYLDIIVKRGWEAAAPRAILQHLVNEGGWVLLNLTDIPAGSVSSSFLQHSAMDLGLKTFVSECAICPYIELPSDWESYLGGLGSSSRDNLKRRTKNLEKRYMTRHVIWQSTDGLDVAMDKLAELHTTRWESKTDRHGFSTEKYREFHKAVARSFAEKGWLQLSGLELDGRIAGMYYEYRYNNKLYYYQAGFNPAYADLSPGLVLRGYIIRKAIAEGLTEIDLLKGAYEHKYRWTTTDRRTMRFEVANRTLGGRMFGVIFMCKQAIKAMIKGRVTARLRSVNGKAMGAGPGKVPRDQ